MVDILTALQSSNADALRVRVILDDLLRVFDRVSVPARLRALCPEDDLTLTNYQLIVSV